MRGLIVVAGVLAVGAAQALGPYTIASVGANDSATRGSSGKRLVYDGTYWWAFYQRDTDTNLIRYAYSADLSVWSENTVQLEPGRTFATDGGALSIAFDAASKVVLVVYYDATSLFSDRNVRCLRGAINDTTISWSSSVVADNLKYPDAGYTQRVAIDGSGKALVQDDDGAGNPRVYRSTSSVSASFDDAGTSWTLMGNPPLLSAFQQASFLAPLGTSKVLVMADDYPFFDFPRVTWTSFDGSSWSPLAFVWNGADVSRTNWGAARLNDTAVFAVGVTGPPPALSLSVFDGTAWAPKAAPAWPEGGLAANSGLPLITDGTDLWAFVIRGDAGNSVAWNRYYVATDSWSGWVDLVTTAASRSFVQTAVNVEAGTVAVVWTEAAGPTYEIKVAALTPDVYFAVGPSTSDDLTTGRPVTCSVSGNTLIFDKAQDSPQFGVGCRVTYGVDGGCYVTGKQSPTVWSCAAAKGGTPAAADAGTPVIDIHHVFDSLSKAVGTGTGGAGELLGTSDLAGAGYVLNLPCYGNPDAGGDTVPVVVDTWKTAPANYVHIYTPTDTARECNQSQRHAGRWDASKYNLKVAEDAGITLDVNHARVEGLQVGVTANNSGSHGIQMYSGQSGGGDRRISGNLFKGTFGPNGDAASAINGGSDPTLVARVWNNIIYGWNRDGGVDLDGIWTAGQTFFVYNNTVVGCYRGLTAVDGGVIVAKNNLSQGNTYDYFGAFDTSSAANLSRDTTSPNSNFRNKPVLFEDAGAEDFHLSASDVMARDLGVDLSTDAHLRFFDDVDGDSRPVGSSWDIGADEHIVATQQADGGALDGGAEPATGLAYRAAACGCSETSHAAICGLALIGFALRRRGR